MRNQSLRVLWLLFGVLLVLAFFSGQWIQFSLLLLIPLVVVLVKLYPRLVRLFAQLQGRTKFSSSVPSPRKGHNFRGALLLWPVVLVVILLVGEMSRSWLVSWFFYVLAALVLLSFTLTRKPVRLLGVTRQLSDSHAEIGQTVTVQVSLNWERPSGPGWMLVQDCLPPTFRAVRPCGRLFMSGQESSTAYTYQVSGAQRGYHSIGPLTISCGDLFGLDQVTASGEDADYLTIFPRIYPIPPLRIPSNRPIGEAPSTRRIYEDTTRIVGVRDYLPGDSLSKIHWKASAHSGGLATKMCEPSSSVEVHMILNLYRADYPGEKEVELACTTAASITAGLLLDKQIVGLQSNGIDARALHDPEVESPLVKPDKGMQQFAAIMSLLGRLQTTETPSLAAYLTQVHSILPWTATILVITHHLGDEDATALESLRRSGFEIAVGIVSQGGVAEESATRAAAIGLPVAMIPTEQHLVSLEFWQPGR